jgi:hypothetical protein
MRKKVTWVIMGPEPYFATCQRCGKQEPMPELPMPLDAFPKFCEYVVAKHQFCREASE